MGYAVDPRKVTRNLVATYGRRQTMRLLDGFASNESGAELAALFGVSRQRVHQWRKVLCNVQTVFTPAPGVMTVLGRPEAEEQPLTTQSHPATSDGDPVPAPTWVRMPEALGGERTRITEIRGYRCTCGERHRMLVLGTAHNLLGAAGDTERCWAVIDAYCQSKMIWQVVLTEVGEE